MELLDVRKYSHGGQEFELKLFGDNGMYKVIAYLAHQQVSPIYSVDFLTHIDYFMKHRENLTEHLFKIATSDIENGLYFHL